MMKLYSANWCPYCQNVLDVIKKLKIQNIQIIEQPHPKEERKELFRVSGQRGIPTLVSEDCMIKDDDEAIIKYLKEKFRSSPFS